MPQPTGHAHQCVPTRPTGRPAILAPAPPHAKPGNTRKTKSQSKRKKPYPTNPLATKHPLSIQHQTRTTNPTQQKKTPQPNNKQLATKNRNHAPSHHQRIRTIIFREGLERIKAKNTGICRGATHGSTMGCAPVGTKGAGQRPSRNKVAAHCTAPSTVSNASVRTLPCPSSACTVRRAPSTPDCPGGRMRSFHGLGAPLRVARII